MSKFTSVVAAWFRATAPSRSRLSTDTEPRPPGSGSRGQSTSLSTATSLFLCCCTTLSAQLIFPAVVERDAPVRGVYRLPYRASGKGELTLRWTDVHGRVVDDRGIPFQISEETEIGFTLDLRRAVAMKNTLQVHFTLDGVNKRGAPDHRDDTTQMTFIARPPDRTWWDYHIVMWQDLSADLFAKLKGLGIDASQYGGKLRALPEFLLNNDLRWYSENIATDFYSEYHRYYPDRENHWRFTQAKEIYAKDPTGKEAFKRHPSFSDATWIKRIHDRLVDAANFWSPYRPLFYSLGDESGIADLASFWDFDFSDESLVEMRTWLKERYGTLAALNRQWNSRFEDWDLVTPDTTNQAMQRPGDNFSAWADHKEWMDISYARALKMGADAVRSVDPEAYVGIGGAQNPGWGGYDYYRISQSLTAIEPYDIGNNIEILRSLNPKMAVVTTSFRGGPQEKHRVWYELLHGNRGLVIWDDNNEYITKDGGTIPPRGQQAAPYYRELRDGLGALLIASQRQTDPIAIHYSQASMRTAWMLAQRPKGDAWVSRHSGSDRVDSEFLRLRESWCRAIEDLGLQYNFVAYGQVEQGELLSRGYRVLVLPDSNSLSAAETQAIREFVEQGGTLIASGEPATFDEHSRRLPQPALADLFAAPRFGKGRAVRIADVLTYHQNRLVGKEQAVHQLIGGILRESGVKPEFAVTDQAGNPVVGVEAHRFRNGGVTIIGLLPNPQLRVNELGPPEFQSNQRFEKPVSVRLTPPADLYAWNLRTGESLGRQKQIQVTLDPFEPTLIAFSPAPNPELVVSAPARIVRGATARIGLTFASPTPAAAHVVHIEVIDPAGKPVPHYSGNLLLPEGSAVKSLPLALNDAPGTWQLRIRDVLTGQTRTTTFEAQ